ncbi:MAG TPA: radical SAM family heme chaperone HemW [Candidatus Limnocylindria bacterium]|nr:radical SAM family heme chaperone HemW [Candidatus Limnocylindria bacterium]
MSGIGLYVHVPFCAARCPYCDFATAPARSPLRAAYLDALAAEIAREGAALGRPRVRTLFFGGGTPSLLDPAEIAVLDDAIRHAFDLRPREVTVEANPATLDRARLEAWAAVGLTRLSLGAQSTTAAGLRALGRTHQPEDIPAAVEAARSVGADVAIDLILGWPGQTAADWRADLARAIALGPDHLSCYPLELHLEREEGATNWPGGWAGVGRWRRDAAARQDEDQVAALYEDADAALAAAGFRHYEIANWARPGKRCLHNLTYWRNGEWLGVGAGAHSHLGQARTRRPAALGEYVAAIRSGAPRLAVPDADPAVDTALLALRLDGGLDLARYASRFGVDARARVRAALASADPSLVEWHGARVALTPRGRLLANEVLVALV